MSDELTTDDGDHRLDEVLAGYLKAAAVGEAPSPEELLARHPDLAEGLAEFFADRAHLERVVEPLRAGAGNVPALGDKVRYFGDYELLEELGRGGFGVIYRARQISLNRIVAVKMILSGQFATPDDVARFKREAEAVANLDHAHIVPIYEVGEHEGSHYFSMKLIEGGPLATLRRSADAPADKTHLRKLVQVVATVARAVHYAHQRGILHRDLKPANILLDAKGEPHVTDFGLAKRVDGTATASLPGAVVGTPSYMAPEQARGAKDLSTAADTYSLGAVLYDLLTGRPPFAAATAVETLLLVQQQDPAPPRTLAPEVDRDLETVCLKCLEKQPEQRYGTAVAVAEELERWLDGEPIQARPVGQAERFWRWCRRNPTVAGLAAAVVVLLVSGITVSSYFAVGKAEEAEKAHQNETAAVTARDDAETALARGLLGPIGVGGDLSEPAKASLWQLAENRGERVWYRFVKEALRSPMTIGQLRKQAEPALHAAVGLEADKRARIEQLLVEQLHNPDLAEEQRVEVAFMLVALGDLNPMTEEVVAATFLIALDRTEQPTNIKVLVEGLIGVVNRLPPERATRVSVKAAATLTVALTKTNIPLAQSYFAKGLAAVAEWLPNEQAVCAKATTALSLALSKTNDSTARLDLADGLAAVAGQLPPVETVRVCLEAADTLNIALAVATYSSDQSSLAAGLVAVVRRLPPEQGAATLSLALTKVTYESGASKLAVGLAEVAERLPPKQAAAIFNVALTNTNNPYALSNLAKGLAAVAGRLPPEQASRVCTEAISLLSLALTKTDGQYSQETLADGLVEVLGRQPPGEAAATLAKAMIKVSVDARRKFAKGLAVIVEKLQPEVANFVCSEVAATLSLALTKADKAIDQYDLAQSLATVAARMPPQQAAHVCAEAVTILSLALTKVNDDPSDEMVLKLGLAALSVHLPPSEAVATLVKTLTKKSVVELEERLVESLAAVVERLPPEEAARVCAEATAALSLALSKTNNLDAQSYLAQGFAVAAGRLPPEQAIRVCTEAAATLSLALTKANAASVQRQLARSLTAVMRGLPPEQASLFCAKAAATFSLALTKTPEANDQVSLAAGLAEVVVWLPPREAAAILAKRLSHKWA